MSSCVSFIGITCRQTAPPEVKDELEALLAKASAEEKATTLYLRITCSLGTQATEMVELKFTAEDRKQLSGIPLSGVNLAKYVAFVQANHQASVMTC